MWNENSEDGAKNSSNDLCDRRFHAEMFLFKKREFWHFLIKAID